MWNRSPNLKYFKKRPSSKFVYAGLITAGICLGSFYYSRLEAVPITQRRRFVIHSKERELEVGLRTYKAVLHTFRDRILPSDHPVSLQVQSIVTQLTQLPELKDQNWKVHVIRNKIPNAFALPGGHIFVFAGILPVADTRDKLAAVLSHEIAHVVARHHAERGAFSFGLGLVSSAVSYVMNSPKFLTNMILDLGLQMPHSRLCESEADEIGLYLMSKACFDPHGAVEMWQSMIKYRVSLFRNIDPSKQKEMSDFWSTHPATQARIDNLYQWMDMAEEMRRNAGCDDISLFRSLMNQSL